MKQRSPRWDTGVKYLRPEKIESAALALIAGYARQFGVTIAPPIPVEEIVESHQGLDLRFEDLQALPRHRRALGAIRVRARQVAVDLTLDPTVYPEREGRYRFTVGHEAGHWELHRHLVVPEGQSSLVVDEAEPNIVCRAGRSDDPKEWQANQFAAYLLMPKDLIYKAWQAYRGSLNPYVAKDEIADLSARWSLGEDETPTVGVARELAQVFRVSGQAMQIRLIGLGLIRTCAPEPSLF